MPPAPVYTVPTVPINGEMGYRLQQNGMDIGEVHPLQNGVVELTAPGAQAPIQIIRPLVMPPQAQPNE